MGKAFKPMLACLLSKGLDSIRYPVFCSKKIDGIRCLVGSFGPDGETKALTRSGEDIPNSELAMVLRVVFDTYFKPRGVSVIDGELELKGSSFNDTQSFIMSRDKPIGGLGITYHVFDLLDSVDGSDQRGYASRIAFFSQVLKQTDIKVSSVVVSFLKQTLINSASELMEFSDKIFSGGEEGVIVRGVASPYKFGRSTENEGWMLKIKEMNDAEARVTGFTQRKTYIAPRELKGSFGVKKYSHSKGDTGTVEELGALTVEGSFNGRIVTFEIGTGFDSNLRREIWDNRESYLGKLVTYKFMPHGSKDHPRHPVFKGFRDARDL